MKAKPVFLSFLLFSICAHSFFCSAAEEPDAVLDIDGEELRAGVNYFILPVIYGFGGGLTASSFGNETCPLSVVKAQENLDNGLPLTFTPVNPKEGVVRVSTDLNIKFSALTTCAQSNVWKLDFDEATGKYIIVTNGVEGNPGAETLSNWFKIEKTFLHYKLVFCPTVCNYCKVICKEVDVFFQDGKGRLVLNDAQATMFMFKKVSTDDQPFSYSA